MGVCKNEVYLLVTNHVNGENCDKPANSCGYHIFRQTYVYIYIYAHAVCSFQRITRFRRNVIEVI